MRTFRLLGFVAALVLLPATPQRQAANAQAAAAKELAGLWEAKRRFGPDVGGPLIIRQVNGEWRAEIAGRGTVAKLTSDTISFALPDGKGSFEGKFAARRTKIVGHWVQPATVANGTPYASPVTLTKDKQNVWRGEVSPLHDELTFYLMIRARDDGTAAAFLKNPERNLGRFIRVDRVEREGDAVKLLAANTGEQQGRVLAEGRYDAESKILSLYVRGITFDFRRVGEGEASDFYPRGRPTVPYVYAPPPALDDGWRTASLERVGISRAGVQKFVQLLIDTPIDSVSSPEIHGVLIARHGLLVLEEYFHGEHRDKPHDTRSAAKSLTSTLFGAAVNAGVPVSVSTPVYQAMNGGFFPPGLDDPRKKSLTVEHLLTMASGLDCDDWDPK
ncbi:MAG TPA: serine hydrolase, partial [Pyrinomonadaceae bacterium]|nr:serine hydrolase [Pyrinomonadaceae bacterium]